MNRRQWFTLLVAWLGWGFDVFDALLFNLVANNCVPALLRLPSGSTRAAAATTWWTGVMTSVLLIGWGFGGIIFGQLADRWGRRRILIATVLLYSLATAASALSWSISSLLVFRIFASLGIGGEWAVGAVLVAESVPEHRRTLAGALLYTAAPVGFLAASVVNYAVAGLWLGSMPSLSWRLVLAAGVIPAVLIATARTLIPESRQWKAAPNKVSSRLRDLFAPTNLASTCSGLIVSIIALVTYWPCSAFIALIATAIGTSMGTAEGLHGAALTVFVESRKVVAVSLFNVGGILGGLATVPLATRLGRRPMFLLYFVASAVALWATFGLPIPPLTRLHAYFVLGLAVYGVGGSFAFYLPELFPVTLRSTGTGFSYNAGRFIAALGPLLVSTVASRGTHAYQDTLTLLSWVACVPGVGVLLLPWILETRGRTVVSETS